MDLARFVPDGVVTPWVSVSLERNDRGGLHCGIVYRDGDGVLHRLHFGWFHYLFFGVYGKPGNRFLTPVACAVPEFDVAHEMWLSTFCGKVARNAANKKIPYNLKHDLDVTFDDDTGAMKMGPDSTGVGCATFVVAVFRSAQHPLIRLPWARPGIEDEVIQRQLVDEMLDDPRREAQAHGRRIAGEIGEPRIAPEHVAGSCLEREDDRPVGYAECDRNGREVVARLDNWQQPAAI